ncbi:AAA domain-containing protein [Flavobacterium yafengii]|uniref:AAA domain-containing protein n=1 Tax=Flavobacterium yafengii TaxID=3041253 RepID=UPI0024A9A4C1|nr:AAA domain-containing protein [Flavobacterium yafengii]MDI6046201.1 AAA domain-containing protein [Flavobacterium yafengii]
MELTEKLLSELQRRLKIGNRRGVHLNAIPANSRYKFDLNRLSHIDKDLPNNFIKSLLTELPLKFRISWKDNVPDLNSLFQEDQTQLVRITKAFENLINQTDAIESEKGINTFGFGFPILARRDRADNKLTVAPILIWSLRIRRTKEFNTWEILRNEDDPIYINEVLINHLQSDSEIEIEQISSEMLDDGLINKAELIEICSNLIKAINTKSPEDLEDTFKKKLETITAIGDKAHYEKLPLNSTNSFIDFGGLFSIFEVQKQNIINDYGDLMELEGANLDLEDMEEHSFQSISSVETDPSQQSILHSLEATRNILIQGPPGTGKSQTLTAILVNALENNKKTIVVCEKRTALEVLHNTLIEKGLNYHCVLIRDIVKDRKTVVDSVRDRVDNSEYKRYRYNYSKESLDILTSKAKELIGNINNKHQKLDKKLIGNKSWPDVVGNLLKELKGTGDDNNLDIDKTLFNYTSQELNSLLDLVHKGQILYDDFSPIASNSFINPSKLIGENPFLIEQSINEDFDIYVKHLAEIKQLLEANKNEFIGLRKSELKTQLAFVNEAIENAFEKEKELEQLIHKSQVEYCTFRKSELDQQESNFSKFITEIDSIFENNKGNEDLTNKAKINSFGFKMASIFSKSKKQTISDHLKLQNNFKKLEECIESSKDYDTKEFHGDLDSKKKSLHTFKSDTVRLKNGFNDKIEEEFNSFHLTSLLDAADTKILFQPIDFKINDLECSESFVLKLQTIKNDFETYFDDLNTVFKVLSKTIAESNDLELQYSFIGSFNNKKSIVSSLIADLELVKESFDSKIRTEFQKISLLKANPNEIEIKSLSLLQEKSNALADKIKNDNWKIEKIKLAEFYKFIMDIETLIQKKVDYFKAEKDLFTIEFKWFQFYNIQSVTNKSILDELKPKSNWNKSFLIHYLNSMLLNAANMELPTDDGEHNELDMALNGIEKEQLKFIKEFWYSKQIDSTREFEQNNINLSVSNLYLKHRGTKNKKLSLRQIVQYDPNLFTNFFPIIFTSPDVASNLFKGMNGYFDIVMFDEASQLRLEDNLPAILKGKQIVIAGDEHQMPPSNYFSKVFDGTVEDEDDIEEENDNKVKIDKDDMLLSCESLLDFGTELNFQRKHLDFHYRSRHPFLIDFSNYAFYNQRLKPLPNNFEYVPIKYIQVNGTFSEHTNEAEAEMVLSIIENNINRLPNGEYPTVGIATFNIAQRNLIKSKIEERKKFEKFSDFNEKIQELELDNPKSNKSFIKNLENIQGDERDVIILSTTYGIGKDGKFAQRFGPINHSKGYKLLNVIITRAKFKVYVCSSIPEQVFMNYKEYLATEGSNNKRAVLYAYLAYSKAVSENSNDLRLSVLTSLSENTTKSVSFDSFVGGDLESPFEEEVYQSLADKLGIEKLIPQLQFAGFRIDIVYDPKRIGVPKIAIECDGAKYHSSREAYLHDRHRQKILENHGFVFHRIWSTNWWRNSSRETTKLIDFIKSVESTGLSKLKDDSKTALAFTDEIEIIEKYISKVSFIDNEKDVEIIQAIERKAPVQTHLFHDEIKLNSKVKVKYVNNGKDISVQIVESNNNKGEIVNGIQKVYIKSPLAVSILGRSIGDIVKVGDLDNFVEILQVAN